MYPSNEILDNAHASNVINCLGNWKPIRVVPRSQRTDPTCSIMGNKAMGNKVN